MLSAWKKSYDKLRQHIKNQRHHFTDKGPSSQSYDFSSSHYGCESWTKKKTEHWRVDAFEFLELEKTFESPLNSKEIKPVNPKGNQPWIFIGRIVAEAEAPIFGHLMQRANSLEKTDGGKDWKQQEKETAEGEMVK